jgi:hypothetical protein
MTRERRKINLGVKLSVFATLFLVHSVDTYFLKLSIRKS